MLFIQLCQGFMKWQIEPFHIGYNTLDLFLDELVEVGFNFPEDAARYRIQNYWMQYFK